MKIYPSTLKLLQQVMSYLQFTFLLFTCCFNKIFQILTAQNKVFATVKLLHLFHIV